MAAIAHLSAIKASLPFINFFDGFRTSHEIDKIKLMDLDEVKELIDEDALNNFRDRAMNTHNPNSRGMAENDDIYFQHTEVRNINYINCVDYVCKYMDKINELNGTNIKPFNYYGDKAAKYVIVAMGSVNETIRETIDYLNGEGNKYGLVEVHLFRPFSSKHLLSVIPDDVERIAVLDRCKEAGSEGEALYKDVVNAVKDKDIDVYGGRYGLASKNTTPRDIKAVYDFLKSNDARSNFTIGIYDDVTNLSLRVDNDFKLPGEKLEFLIYGYGSDGMISTSKDLIKIIGDNTDNYVQGYFQYDSKKSGGVTRSHIRISDSPIRKTYYVDSPSLVVVSKDSYIYKYDVIDNICEGGILLLNTNLKEEDLVKSLPNKVKYLIASKDLKFYVIDAYKLVEELGLRGKISTCMEMCIFNLIKIIDDDRVREIMKMSNEKRFRDKGRKIVDVNNRVVDLAINGLREVKVDRDWINLSYEDGDETGFNEIINNLKGDSLPVSAFLDKISGIYKAGSTKYEKREIAERVPCWIKENCIQCNQCSFVCPHAVIRPFLTKKEDEYDKTISSFMPRNVNFSIGISYKDCTGCGLCYNACPGKMGKKAIELVEYDKKRFKQDDFDYLMEHNINGDYKFKIMNVKNEGFIRPKFEFNGSCAGCGETPYLKNLTQIFNNNLYIANATGCSSIYGGSVPSTPYSVAWASSLFEDNAEFGLGILSGINIKREKIAKYMEDNLDNDYDLFRKWLDYRDDYDKSLEVYKEIDFDKHKELVSLKDYLVKSSMWIVGGDGFAYDIGYGGLDHILSRDDDINILILDTEVYSNTGGQVSKSSNMGTVASFSTGGKSGYKKDLARIAMCYPQVYVACCNIGYDKEQYLKALREADNHKGPSIVIVYAPCIEHGINKGMQYSMFEGNLATSCGYFPIFRYNPDSDKFSMDSKNVDFDRYDEFLSNENRYNKLKRSDNEKAMKLLNAQKQWAIKRYEYYRKMDSSELM
jgi:pyruvate-ferredoxin/flavodoxin oxidoreductase